jgi:hypothetical protein
LKKNLKVFFSFLLFITWLAYAGTSGPEDTYYVLEDFDNQWLIYDSESDRFVPFTRKDNASSPAHSLILKTALFKEFDLLVRCDDAEGQLLVNNSIYKSFKKGEWLILPVKELLNYGNEVLLTVYGTNNLSKKQVFVGSEIRHAPTTASSFSRNRLMSIKPRPDNAGENALVLIFITIFGFSTLLAGSSPKTFTEYFTVKDLLAARIRETRSSVSHPISKVNLGFICLSSMLTAFVYTMIANEGVFLFFDHVPFDFKPNAGNLLILFITIASIAFFLHLLKYLLLTVSGQLFGLGKTVNIHFYKNIQFMLISFSVLGIFFYAYSVQHFVDKKDFMEWLPIVLTIIYSVRIGLAFLSILKNHNIQYLFLIAYLCVVEVLPAIIGLRLAF